MKLGTNISMKIWGVLFALVAFVAGAKADNKLVIEDFDIVPGETKTISVALDNTDKISSLQFDALLPKGLSFEKGSTRMNKERLAIHSLGGSLRDINANDEEHVRFVILHQVVEASKMDLSAFKGNSGEIFTFQVKASSSYKGGKIRVYNIEGSDATPLEPVEHDMDPFEVAATPSVGSFSLTEKSISKHMTEEATASVGISIENIVSICGMQAYVELPENLVIESMTIGDRVSENYIATPTDMDKSGTILLSSIMAQNFAGNEGVVLTLNLKAVGAVKGQLVVKDVVATDMTGEASYKIGDAQAVDVEFIPCYAVAVAEGIENGTVTADVQLAEEGEKVKLTVAPAEGYQLSSLSVVAGDESVAIAEDTTFVMPASDVTVSAVFEKIPVPEFDIDKEFTSLESLNGAVFTIVNKETGKALYGSNNQNLGYDVAEVAFDESNSGFYFKIDTLSAGTEDEALGFRLLTPAGEEYNIWGNPGYLNSQSLDVAQCSFILGLNNQNGQDIKNGAAWDVQYVEGKGFTLLNKGTGKYLTSNDAAKSDEPVYWTFCTIKGTKIATGIEGTEAAEPTSVRKVVENGNVVIYRNGVKTTVSGISTK